MQNFEKVVNEVVKEAASFPQRAWSGKLSYVDTYLSHLYPYMSKTDQELKDKIFGAYYRFYNDGDIKKLPVKSLKLDEKFIKMYENFMSNIPSNMKKHKELQSDYKIVLEAAVDKTMKILLAKYKNIISRQKVYYEIYKETAEILQNEDYSHPYWINKILRIKEDPQLLAVAEKLKKQWEKWIEDTRSMSMEERNKSKPKLDPKDLQKLKDFIDANLKKKYEMIKLEDKIK